MRPLSAFGERVMRGIIRGIAFGALLLALTGCAQPYETPYEEELAPRGSLEPSQRPFKGISSLLAAAHPGRVLWTHGMCAHDFDWVKRRIGLVNKALGSAGMPLPPPQPFDKAYTVNWRFHTARGDLDAAFLVWSPLVQSYRDSVTYANFDAGALDHASLNDKFKYLLNQCLVDAVVYSGKNGDPVRVAMIDAVCAALGGQSNAGDCNFVPGANIENVAFVTESLGSKMLFDAIRKIWNDQCGSAARADLAERVRRISTIYMAANQVPLLDQGSPIPPAHACPGAATTRSLVLEPSSTRAFFEIVSRSRQETTDTNMDALPSLDLIAFTDPNDILSYRLGASTPTVGGLNLINVIVSNDWTFFGALERPDNAHCGYVDNPNVIRLMVEGHPGGPIPGLGPTKPDGACLSG